MKRLILLGSGRRSERLSRVVSRVFDPVVLVPLILLAVTSSAYLNGYRWGFLIFLMMLDAVLPGFVLVYFIKRGQVGSGWDIEKREERVPLFFFVVTAHLIGVLSAWFLDRHPLAEYLSVFWFLTMIFAMVTTVWKISIHSGVIAAMVMFVMLTRGWHYAPLLGLVLLVVWARVVGKHHRLGQALVGASVPIVMMPLLFWVLGLQ